MVDLDSVEREFGTLLEPNSFSWKFFKSEGWLVITSNVREKEFMICYNFVIKYLNRLCGVDLRYVPSGFSSAQELSKYKFNKVYLAEDLFRGHEDLVEELEDICDLGIVFYSKDGVIVSHVGFVFLIDGVFYGISKFGKEGLVLHTVESLRKLYGRHLFFYRVKDEEYLKFMARVSVKIEDRLRKLRMLDWGMFGFLRKWF